MSENNTNVPKIRFPGFTDDWKQRELGKVVDVVRSYSLSRDVETDEGSGFRYVHYGDIHKKVADLIESDEQLPMIKAGDYDLLQKGDVIVADASEDYMGIAEPSVLLDTPSDKVVAGLHTIAMRPKEITPLFFYYLLHTDDFKKFGGRVGTGMKVFGITTKNLFKYPAVLPIKEEQEKIGKFFYELDHLITLHQRKLNHLQEEKKSLLQKMFPKNGSDVPEIRFPGFTHAWEQRKLGEMMEVTSVKRIHQSDWTDEGVRFLRARDIVSASKGEEPTEYLYISQEKYDEYSRISGKVKLGDLLVTGVGSIGVPMLVNHEEPLYFKDGNIIWFKNEKQLDGNFFYYSFIGKNVQKYIRDVAGIGTVGTYTIDSGKKTPIQIPSFEEQERIGTFFMNLDHLITLHQRKLNHLQEQKKSLLQQMFV
jgi:type I restriction enzyme S subunit